MYSKEISDKSNYDRIASSELIYEITGGRPLHGEVQISGAKNAALPLLAASLLTDQPIELGNLPKITDIDNLLNCLNRLGKKHIYLDAHTIRIIHTPINELIVPEEFATTIRASIVLLGPLLARHEKVILPLPGGCSIGKRPIDLHIKALSGFGVDIVETENSLICTRLFPCLKGNTINFPLKTVTGTENALMAAVLAEGVTYINNAAMEPEVIDLAMFLNQLGARIKGAGSDTIEITGVEQLNGCDHYSIIPDRIEAGTFLVAAAITKGCITLKGINYEHLGEIVTVLKQAGATIYVETNAVRIDMRDKQTAAFQFITQPFPGFPTDMQSQFLSLATIAQGQSVIEETLFESRFNIVHELMKMGAVIKVTDTIAQVEGIQQLTAACVQATDLRAGAALVCAALAAKGTTVVSGVNHIERGYEDLICKLKQLGAMITITSRTHKQSKSQTTNSPSGFFKLEALTTLETVNPEGIIEYLPSNGV